MKKYLMTGLAAVALCAAMTSCSKGDVYDEGAVREREEAQEQERITNNIEQAKSNYATAFENAFGPVGANVDWGFSSRNAGTRSVEYLNTLEPGSNKNRNQWAAYDDVFSLVVPTPLSEGQKLRVKAYFQTHPNLTYEAPDMTNYFVQQVYTGHTSVGENSAEEYTALNGSDVIGSAHMDKLTINGKHVFDFNGADNVNTASDVLNNGEDKNSSNFHSDQITLMCGTLPTYVGYETSEASILKTNCCALVDAKTIDDWARDAANYVNGAPIGKDVWYGKDEAGYDNSYWERSFVGLDYEQIPASDAYATVAWNDPAIKYVKLSDLQPGYIYDSKANTTITKAEYSAAHNNTEYLLDEEGNKIPYVLTNANQLLGTTSNFANQTDYMPQVQGYGMVLDIQKIYKKVADHCLPINDKNLMEWAKNIGGRDYYFTDWIVTLAPAKDYTKEPDTHLYRVIAEDLNASQASDFDFNDVVFDVVKAENGKTTLKLIACGGIYKLTVGGVEVHGLFGQSEPDENGLYSMFNTGAGASHDPVEFEINGTYETPEQIKNIVIKVWKPGTGDDGVELTAERGVAACKILVDDRFTVVPERHSIADANGNFTTYVRGNWSSENEKFWWVQE